MESHLKKVAFFFFEKFFPKKIQGNGFLGKTKKIKFEIDRIFLGTKAAQIVLGKNEDISARRSF